MKLMRSCLFVPGHNQRLLESASQSEADVLLLDLEDSVQPASNKRCARELIRKWLQEERFVNKLVYPRVNDRESGHLLRDVYELAVEGVTGFMYPKSNKGEDVYFFCKLLETIEYELDFEIGKFKIIPLIETSAAVLNVQDICQASSRVTAVAYGCEDFISDLGGIHDEGGLSLYIPRAMIAMAARANGVIPIDTVHIRVHDLEDLQRNLEVARTLGFQGMLVLHPKEIDTVHRYFTPSKKELESAQEMLRLAKEAEEEGKGVAVFDGRFVGSPMVRSALELLERNRLLERKEGG